MWLGVQHLDRDALNIFRREIAPAGTGMGETDDYFVSFFGIIDNLSCVL